MHFTTAVPVDHTDHVATTVGRIPAIIACWAFASIFILFISLTQFFQPSYNVPAYLVESGFLAKLSDQGFNEVNLVGGWVALILMLDLVLETIEHFLPSSITIRSGVRGSTSILPGL